MFITSIATANPAYKIQQNQVLDFMIKAHQLDPTESHELRVLYRATGIQSRYTSLSDYQKTSGFNFFPDNEQLEPFPSTAQRSNWYKKEALSLSLESAKKCINGKIETSEITHLITVSCTGMTAPGLDIELVQQLGLAHNVERSAVNFMGCYAAFNALKLANHICSAQKANVLIVCTELCTLHFQKENTQNNLLANALFADGSAAVLVQSQPVKGSNLQLEQFICDMIPQAKEEMAWEIGDFGFEMKLSAYVPEAIAKGITPLINTLRKKVNQATFDYYAIHPGGKGILTAVEDALGITKEANAFSHQVLRDYGNMSSPTVLFVLNEIFAQLKPEDDGKMLLSFAFGPGLTLESMIGRIKWI